MTDSPTPRRHRGSRRASRRSRGLIGPIVSALSVLLAIGPVVWLMSRDSSTVDDATKVLNVSEDTWDDGGRSVVEGTKFSGAPDGAVTRTQPDGTTATVAGTPALGSTASTSTSDTPATTPPGTPGTPASIVSTPTGSLTAVTVSPTASRTANTRNTSKPRPTRTTPTKPETTEPRPSETATSRPPADGGGTNSQERAVLNYTNQIREQQGCGPLRLDGALVEAAGRHASDMVRRRYLDHTNPDGQDPGDRMAAAGYRGSGWGENIAAGYDSAQKVVAAWMRSEGHRRNILNCRFTSIGIGYDPGQVRSDWGPGSWVQDFGRS
ncbi:CAP domain-containing protein [Kribbella turkmenica]|uniref:CAP domain-containing protein n=1 Tax=Kribbella turkmenica TaxID=2530375 RepID=A0A4V2YE47_9ACTN|nr:CAP domain-containing protein [Kribbella turkmenica]TDD17946.1 CAP domain-containing protein [Kribbella turkmenica]